MAKRQSNTKREKAVWGKVTVTPVGRLCFPTLGEPEAFDEAQNPKYSCQIVINPGKEFDALKAACEELARQAFKSEAAQCRMPWTTGEKILEKMAEPSETMINLYKGRLRLSTGSGQEYPPKIYVPDDQAGKRLLPRRPNTPQDLQDIKDALYPGCFGRLAVTPRTWKTALGFGVTLTLQGAQFVRDGERLGTANIDSAFDVEMSEDGSWDEGTMFDSVEEASDVSI